MIEVTAFDGQGVFVFGLGRSGLSAVRALAAGGTSVLAWDDKAEARDAAAAFGAALTEPQQAPWHDLAALVLSPGVPLTHPEPHPVVKRAKAAFCPIIGDIELLCRAAPEATTIAITGTNGKSTTTALTGHILEQADMNVAIGGNLGIPVLDLPRLGAGGIYVLELSSYQLDLLDQAAFDIAVLLNITPDHLDRHGGLDGYIAVKASLFSRLRGAKMAVCGIDDAASRTICESLVAEDRPSPIPISGHQAVASGVYAEDGLLHPWPERGGVGIDLRSIPTLPGVHNHQNAAAAFAAARAAGVTPEAIERGLTSFPGLAHRQEQVGLIEGVCFVNDSKATNPDAAARALACYQDIYWIAGGRAKDGGLEPLTRALGSVRHAFLIGEAAEAMARKLPADLPVSQCETLEKAVAEAHLQAVSDGAGKATVLLSPACASFDQFRDFEARGDAFREFVAGLSGRP